MKCSDAQNRLSAYHDGELSTEAHKVIARHLAECEVCAAELAGFEDMSRAVRRMPTSELPPKLWDKLSAELADGEPAAHSTARPETRRNKSTRPWASSWQMALAASILLMLGAGFWLAGRMDHSHTGEHDAEFVMTMDHYLRQLPHDPEAAEQFLLNKYDGQTVDADGAIRLVGYRPAVSQGLPEGYLLASTSVLKMPCCTCVKAVCKREDGSTLVLFEHDDEETDWFGHRPSNMAMCGDKECCLVDLDSSLAATWKRGSRSLTAVGVRDKDEVNRLVSWLEESVTRG